MALFGQLVIALFDLIELSCAFESEEGVVGGEGKGVAEDRCEHSYKV